MIKTLNRFCQSDELLSAIDSADSILLFSHLSPDGDTLGSALALKIRLERMKKRVCLVLDGEIPCNLRFLPGVNDVKKPADETADSFALAIAVDVSCAERLGACGTLFENTPKTALIDHHATNGGFAALNLIDGSAPATAVLIYRLFQAMPEQMSKEEAICLYTALSTDTGNFVYESTNAECFLMMSQLMDAGLPLAQYSGLLFRQKSRVFVRLLGQALSSLRFIAEGAVAGLKLSREQIEAIGASAAQTDGIVDYAIDVEGVKLAYFARETETGCIKMSIRAMKPYYVDEVAVRFGGGGHQLAAGCTLDLPMEEAVHVIEKALISVYQSGKKVI